MGNTNQHNHTWKKNMEVTVSRGRGGEIAGGGGGCKGGGGVMQLTRVFMVGGLNLGRANMAPPPPATGDRLGFKPPT